MADVVDFLERMGQDSALRHASGAMLEQAMRDALIGPRERAALMSSERAELEAVLAAQSNVCCMINIPEDEDEAEGVKQQKAA